MLSNVRISVMVPDVLVVVVVVVVVVFLSLSRLLLLLLLLMLSLLLLLLLLRLLMLLHPGAASMQPFLVAVAATAAPPGTGPPAAQHGTRHRS